MTRGEAAELLEMYLKGAGAIRPIVEERVIAAMCAEPGFVKRVESDGQAVEYRAPTAAGLMSLINADSAVYIDDAPAPADPPADTVFAENRRRVGELFRAAEGIAEPHPHVAVPGAEDDFQEMRRGMERTFAAVTGPAPGSGTSSTGS